MKTSTHTEEASIATGARIGNDVEQANYLESKSAKRLERSRDDDDGGGNEGGTEKQRRRFFLLRSAGFVFVLRLRVFFFMCFYKERPN